MKTYIISVVISSVLISLSELIIPQGKLKTVVSTVFSIVLLISMISPLVDFNFDDSKYVFSNTDESITESKQNFDEYFDLKAEEYYSNRYKNLLKENDLICERVIVEISKLNIQKIQIFLSNLVIPENNEHINNNVIRNYVAEILGIPKERIEIYA